MGLSAAELPTETLFPGDMIEYFSMAFVAGDKRGHRIAKVLRVDRRHEEFPIRLDTQEMIPLTLMLKRNRDRNGFEISSKEAKWRKLRTFKLVDGKVEGETRADRLNAGLKKGIADAMKSTKKMLVSAKAEKAQASSKKLMSSFFTKLQPATVPSADDSDANSHSSVPDSSTWHHKCQDRKPLATRDNEELARKPKACGGSSPKKKCAVTKLCPLEPRPRKQEPEKRGKFKSLKRKRVGQSLQKHPREDRAREGKRSTSKVSEFFGGRGQVLESKKKRAKQNLSLFLNHVDEAGLDAHLAREKAEMKKNTKKVVKADRVTPAKSNVQQIREKARGSEGEVTKAQTMMDTWVIPRKKSSGLEHASEAKKPRTLNLAPPEPANPPPKHRKGELDLMMKAHPGDAYSSRDGEARNSSYRDHYDRVIEGQPKQRSSLGTLSALVGFASPRLGIGFVSAPTVQTR